MNSPSQDSQLASPSRTILSLHKARNISSQNSLRRHQQLAPLPNNPKNTTSLQKLPPKGPSSDHGFNIANEESPVESYRKPENFELKHVKRAPQSHQNPIRPPVYPMPKPLQEALLKVSTNCRKIAFL